MNNNQTGRTEMASYEQLMAKSKSLAATNDYEALAQRALQARNNQGTFGQAPIDYDAMTRQVLGQQGTWHQKLGHILDAERQGTLSAEKAELLAEARKRGLLDEQSFEVETPDRAAQAVAEIHGLTLEQQHALTSAKQRLQAAQSDGSDFTPEQIEALAQAAARRRQAAQVSNPDALRSLSELSRNPQVRREIPRTNEWLGGVMPSPRQAVRNLKENVLGDDDPTTLNRGEAVAAALNKAGESMTLGLVGDEAAGKFDELIGRGDADERTEFYRDQERQLWEQHPGKAITAELGGALIGPGKGAGTFINAAKTTGGRIMRGALTGASAAATYGFAEGEDGLANRATDAAQSGAIGALGGGAFTAAGQGFNRALRAIKGQKELGDVIPSVESLRETAKGLYERARALGGELGADDMQNLSHGIHGAMREAGYDAQLHPRIKAVLNRFSSETGPKSLQELEILRRVVSNAAASLQPDERRLASQIIESLDDAVDGMGGGSAALREARDTWSRLRRMEVIEGAIERASNEKNFAAALQTQFRALLRNPKKLRGFSQFERSLVERVAKGSLTGKSLRGLQAVLSPTGIPGMAIAGGTAIAGPGVAPALGVAGTGLASRAIADALTKGAANKAKTQIGMSEGQRRILDALLRRKNPLARAPGSMGSLLEAFQ